MSKAKIIGELGESALLLPALVNEGLAANDRAKYRMTLLQTARAHADHPGGAIADLKRERIEAGEPDAGLDAVTGQSRRDGPDDYFIPGVQQICQVLVEDVRRMIAPFHSATGLSEGVAITRYEDRLEKILSLTPSPPHDHIAGTAIDALTAGPRKAGDSLHVLVMDLHKELNRLQAALATETIDGASVYGLRDEDRPLIAAFMAGLNRTCALKFDHPGLGTTATRQGDRLVIQNDIGLTAAHVLVVHVSGESVTLIYTDVHIERLVFFQGLFDRFAVTWQDTVSKRLGAGDDLYHMSLGSYAARDPADLLAYLTHLGSRLVFLIDWNRARKRLRKFARRRVCLAVLRWAADHDVGHMGFLALGGDQLIFDALRIGGLSPLPPARLLSDDIGPEKAEAFLRFTLQAASEGLRNGRSEFLIRDEISAELRHYIDTAHQWLLESAAEHASLTVELALAARDLLSTAAATTDQDYVARIVRQARKWEHRADQLVSRSRGSRGDDGTPIVELLVQADDIPDAIEDGVFRLSLLLADPPADPSKALAELVSLVADGAREYLKAVETARCLDRGSPRERVEDFLAAVDRIMMIEHTTDDVHRAAQTEVLKFKGTFKQWHLTSRAADIFEEAADALLRAALRLRDYILCEVLRR